MLLQDDEKDLQQILVLAARILERQNMQNGAPLSRSSAPDVPPVRRIPERKGGKKIIMFPVQTNAPQARAIRRRIEPTEQLTQKQQQPPASEETKNAAEKATDESPIFDEKELNAMPRYFRKIFRTDKTAAHVRKKRGVYEIRFQADGVRLSASSKTLQTAKEKFVSLLCDTFPNGIKETPRARKIAAHRAPLVRDYLEQWAEIVKKPYIKETTFKMYCQIMNAYIFPAFASRTLESLSAFELQDFINAIVSAGKFRTAEKVALVLSAALQYAADDGIIQRSPMRRVILPKYEEEHGAPLSREEECALVSALELSPRDNSTRARYVQAFVFLLYTGLRRSELSSVQIENGFVSVQTSKQRKGYKEKLRKIPVSPMLARVLPFIDIQMICGLPVGGLTRFIKLFFPAHHLHDLRHTFITRAQECGISRPFVSLWAGHAADTSITSNVYTHLEQNEEIQRKEMEKFIYSFPEATD